MRSVALAALVSLAALNLSACATSATWMGADAEKTYDKTLEATRLAESLNNDDYYELMHEGRILVFSDAKDYKVWKSTGEMPLAVTKFRAGPNGETVKFSLMKRETKTMETKVGYKGGSQNLYEGNIPGLEKGFFGWVKRENTYYVFDNYNALTAFRKGGEATGAQAAGPEGSSVVYVGASSVPTELAKRFNDMQ